MVLKHNIKKFQDTVLDYYRMHGRHDLLWRHTIDPYRIMISEVMLQQTQVSRVIEKYEEFLSAFPTITDLAQSNLADVLKVWSGMGYNRRAKFLKDAAEVIVRDWGAKVPGDFSSLLSLPGIGEYTAHAIRVFAFNFPDTMIETNIRAVYIHHFFETPEFLRTGLRKKILDSELLPLIKKSAIGHDPREWHWALMDYGSYLKKTHPNPSRKSATYTKQSKFEGSLRQARGAILRLLKDGPKSEQVLSKQVDIYKDAFAGLVKDCMIKKEKGFWQIV